MPCNELVETITAYIEDSMPAPDRQRFEAHLAECQGCARYLAQMRRTIALTGTLRDEDLDGPERYRLIEAFRAWKSDDASGPRP